MGIESNPFWIAPPNLAGAISTGVGAYKDASRQRIFDTAGQAVASGDYQGAARALLEGGDLQHGLALMNLIEGRRAAEDFSSKFGGAPGIASLQQPPQLSPASPPQPSLAPQGPVSADRPPIPSSARVVGDAEGVKAGLYDAPKTPGAAPPLQSGLPMPQHVQNPGTDVPGLIRSMSNPSLPAPQREIAKVMLSKALEQNKTPDVQSNYALYRAQGGNLSFFDYEKQLKQAGAQAITVDQRGETEEAKAIGRGAGERASNTVAAATKAATTLQNLSRMSVMLDQVDQGKVQPARMNISAWAKSLGLDDTVAERLGLDPKGVGTAQAVQALSNELAMGRIGQGGIPANNFSDADRNFLTQTVPQIATDPQGNKIMIESARRMAQLDIQKGRDWLTYKRAPENKGKSFDDFEVDWSNKIAKQDLFGDLREQAARIVGNAVPRQPNPQQQAPRQGRDGKFYLPDPNRPGKYLRVDQ